MPGAPLPTRSKHTALGHGQVPKPKLRRLITAQVLFREGDPPGPLYVVCSGNVRVFRRDLTSADRPATIDLARLGAGSVFGELAPILGPRQPDAGLTAGREGVADQT